MRSSAGSKKTALPKVLKRTNKKIALRYDDRQSILKPKTWHEFFHHDKKEPRSGDTFPNNLHVFLLDACFPRKETMYESIYMFETVKIKFKKYLF